MFTALAILLGGAHAARAQDPAKPGAPAADPAKPATPTAAGAAPAGPKPKWVEACEADMKKLCKEEMKGDVRPCLFKNIEQLVPDCAKFMKLYKVAEVCKDDIEKLCKEASQKGLVGRCLVENKDNISKECRSMLVKGSKQHQAEEKAAKAEEKLEAKAGKPEEKAPAKSDKTDKTDKTEEKAAKSDSKAAKPAGKANAKPKK